MRENRRITTNGLLFSIKWFLFAIALQSCVTVYLLGRILEKLG